MFRSVLLLVFCLSLTSCDDDDGLAPGTAVDNGLRVWLESYSERYRGQELNYGPNNRTVINNKTEFLSRGFDCTGEGLIADCQYESVALELKSLPEDEIYSLTIMIMSGNNLLVNVGHHGSFANEVFRINFDTQELFEYAGFYSINYQESFRYDNESLRAFEVLTMTEEPPILAFNPPKRFILVEGHGVVEWEDYSGNVFHLQE